jgi:hypothetical protein
MAIKINPIQPSSLISHKSKQVNAQKHTKEKNKNFKEILQNLLKEEL